MEKIEEINKSSDLEKMELKANLNPEQREYLEVLKDRMKKVLGNKTKQELAKAGDLVTLKNYRAILLEILDFLKTKQYPKDKLMEFNNKKILFPQYNFLKAIARQLKLNGEKKGYFVADWETEESLGSDIEVDEKGNITSLSVFSRKLGSFPDLSVLTELSDFNCSFNELTELCGLDKLTKLKYLNCSNNHLNKLPDLQNLTKLKRADLYENHFSWKEKKKITKQLPLDCLIKFQFA